jgi:hypothetical protein
MGQLVRLMRHSITTARSDHGGDNDARITTPEGFALLRQVEESDTLFREDGFNIVVHAGIIRTQQAAELVRGGVRKVSPLLRTWHPENGVDEAACLQEAGINEWSL